MVGTNQLQPFYLVILEFLMKPIELKFRNKGRKYWDISAAEFMPIIKLTKYRTGVNTNDEITSTELIKN